MKASLALACGEVSWERQLLEAIERSPDPIEVRRYVDVNAVAASVEARELGAILIVSPALRGFAQDAIERIGRVTPLVVLIDSIRPPWLATAGLDCREVSSLNFASLVEELQSESTSIPREIPDALCGGLTIFAGTSGGVGVTSLAWLRAVQEPDALVVDANTRAPLMAFLAGAEAQSASLLDAIAALANEPRAPLREHQVLGRVLTLPLAGSLDLAEREAQLLADAASAQFAQTIIDIGPLQDDGFARALLGRAHRLVLVATAAPSGVLRLPEALASIRREEMTVDVVINRLRDSAAGSAHARSAIRGLVERACGLSPQFVEEDPVGFDSAWLSGDWKRLAHRLPKIY
jgi:hypothetical protein